VATQRFDDAHLVAASPSLLVPRIQMASYASTFASAQAIASSGLRAKTEWASDAIVNLRLLGKGVGWALAIEGAAALSLYALWHMWQLWM